MALSKQTLLSHRPATGNPLKFLQWKKLLKVHLSGFRRSPVFQSQHPLWFHAQKGVGCTRVSDPRAHTSVGLYTSVKRSAGVRRCASRRILLRNKPADTRSSPPKGMRARVRACVSACAFVCAQVRVRVCMCVRVFEAEVARLLTTDPHAHTCVGVCTRRHKKLF